MVGFFSVYSSVFLLFLVFLGMVMKILFFIVIGGGFVFFFFILLSLFMDVLKLYCSCDVVFYGLCVVLLLFFICSVLSWLSGLGVMCIEN